MAGESTSVALRACATRCGDRDHQAAATGPDGHHRRAGPRVSMSVERTTSIRPNNRQAPGQRYATLEPHQTPSTGTGRRLEPKGDTMISRIKAMRNDRGGVNAVELIVLIALVALAIIAGATVLGTAINAELGEVATETQAL